jgi:hypothetical protein
MPSVENELNRLDEARNILFAKYKANGVDSNSVASHLIGFGQIMGSIQAQPEMTLTGAGIPGLVQSYITSNAIPEEYKQDLAQLAESFARIYSDELRGQSGSQVTNGEFSRSSLNLGNITKILTDKKEGDRWMGNNRTRMAEAWGQYGADIKESIKRTSNYEGPGSLVTAPYGDAAKKEDKQTAPRLVTSAELGNQIAKAEDFIAKNPNHPNIAAMKAKVAAFKSGK